MDYNNIYLHNSNSEIKSHVLIADINKIQNYDKIKTEIDFSTIHSHIIQENIII